MTYTMDTVKFDPPIKRNGVEVTSINRDLHTIHFVLHVSATTADVQTLEMRAQLTGRVRDMVHYLEHEGFINTKENWLTHMGVILHPPGDSGSIYKTA